MPGWHKLKVLQPVPGSMADKAGLQSASICSSSRRTSVGRSMRGQRFQERSGDPDAAERWRRGHRGGFPRIWRDRLIRSAWSSQRRHRSAGAEGLPRPDRVRPVSWPRCPDRRIEPQACREIYKFARSTSSAPINGTTPWLRLRAAAQDAALGRVRRRQGRHVAGISRCHRPCATSIATSAIRTRV